MTHLQNDIILSADKISKKYYHHKGSVSGSGKEEDAFWALKDASFELRKGEILGIIGPNGAGKSTLLKILSEIIPPTSGQVSYSGSILSILDIGTGFHPDLSGYDNIFLNASLLGMKKKETLQRADEIINFSGIGDFIHEPVKNYSSGMYLRLALSIALFTNNEIILLDEVISVGDAEFRMKAIQMIRDQATKGRACIMISHDLNSIVQLCDRCLLMEKGSVIYAGSAADAVQQYYESISSRSAGQRQLPEHDVISLLEASVEKEAHFTDDPIKLKLRFAIKKKEDIRVILKIRLFQTPVLTDSLAYRRDFEPTLMEPGVYELLCVVPGNFLNKGNYFIDLLIGSEKQVFIDYASAAKFNVQYSAWEAGKNWNSTGVVYPIRPSLHWKIERSGNL